MRGRRDTGVLAPFRSLLAAQVVGTGLGLLFWVTVARVVPGAEVGVAAAAISTQTLLGTLTALGLGTLLVAELPHHAPGRQRQLVLRALGLVAVAGLVVGGLVAALGGAGLLGVTLEHALTGPASLVLVAGVVAAGWAVVLDEAVLGLGRSGVQVVRNAAAAGLRFPLAALLLLAGERDATVLMACWVLPLLVSIAGALLALRLPAATAGPDRVADARTYVGPALRHHALTLALAAGPQLMPVVAAMVLTPVANAQFAIAWLVATFVFLPPYLLAVALFAHGSRASERELRTSMATTLPAALGLSLLLCLGAWTLGRPALHVFGGDYADASWALLALLVPAGLWMVVKDHLVTLWRVQRRFGHATRLAGLSLFLEVTGAAIGGAVAGGRGLALGWLAAIGVTALLAVPVLRSALRGIRWRVPTPRRVRTERGAASWALVAAGLVAAVAIAFGVVAAGQSGARPAPVESTLVCPPGTDRPGPLLDLGVQAATGEPGTGLRTRGEVDRLVDLAAEAGASVISTSLSWRTSRLAPDAPYDWTGLDRVVGSARARGLEVRVQLVGMPDWAREGRRSLGGAAAWRPPLTSSELRAWSSFVTDVVEHLAGRATYVEVWDEPNNADFWATGPDPAAFARLLERTYAAVKAVDPAVQVVSGSLAGNDLGFLGRTYDALDQQADGDDAPRPFDLVGLHPFTGAAPTEERPDERFTSHFGPVNHSYLGYRDVHALMAARGDGDVGLYVGEFGYSTAVVSDEQRAEYASQALAVAACTPYLQVVSWYYLHPTPWNPTSWTLLDEQLRPNLTYRALQQWSSAARGASCC